jgi:hypothetical protein
MVPHEMKLRITLIPNNACGGMIGLRSSAAIRDESVSAPRSRQNKKIRHSGSQGISSFLP